MHKSHKSTNFLMMLLACALIFALATPALSREEPVGKLTYFSGTVIIKSKGSWAAKPTLNHLLYSFDKVVTRLGTIPYPPAKLISAVATASPPSEQS